MISLFATCSLSFKFIPEAFQSESFGSFDGQETGIAITVDGVGHVYIAGTTTAIGDSQFGEIIVPVTMREADPADVEVFEPLRHPAGGRARNTNASKPKRESPTVNNLEGNADVFVAKFTAKGETVWVRRIGSEETESVTSIAYRHGVIYVAGQTSGAIDGKDTPAGTSDLFATAFNEDGSAAWAQPLQIGSGGNDSIQAIALDEGIVHGTPACPYIYIAGRVGGELFQAAPEMKTDEKTCACHSSGSQTDEPSNSNGETLRSAKYSKASTPPGSRQDFVFNVSSGAPITRSPQRSDDVSDMFVAKVSLTGSIVQAVQIPLSRNNSADAIAATGGKLYVAVNSYGKDALDPSGSSSLLVLCSEDLSYRTVFPDSAFAHAGDVMQSMAIDLTGNVFLAGLTVRGRSASKLGTRTEGNFIIRKYSVEKRQFVWETQIGSSKHLPHPKVSICTGKQTHSVFAAGHGRGFYRARTSIEENENQETRIHPAGEDTGGNKKRSFKRGLLHTGLTILSTSDGRELITWDKLVQVPHEYEDMQAIALDGAENVVFTGQRWNRDNQKWDACLGSFGSKGFSSQSMAVNRLSKEDGTSPTYSTDGGTNFTGALLTGLVCMAASISLMVVAAVFVMTRTWVMSRTMIVSPEGGFYYEDAEKLSKFEELAQKAHEASSTSGELETAIVAGSGTRHLSQGGGSMIRRSTRSRGGSKVENGPGGSAEPV